jgi:hypothetical protein
LRKATEEGLSVVEVGVILSLHCILSPKIKPDAQLYPIGHFCTTISEDMNQSIRYMTQHIGNLIPDLSEELIHVLRYAIPFAQAGESPGWCSSIND